MKRIPTLDGWRAVAIAGVLLNHAATYLYPSREAFEAGWLHFGEFGVDIFFGLSGLLITKLLLQEWRETGSFGLKAFYIRRGFRILPPYFAFLAVYTLAGLWQSRLELWSCLLFFRDYVPDALSGRESQHLWSLSIEEHFYLLWPGLLAWIGARKSRDAAVRLALLVALWRMIESQLATPLFPGTTSHFRTDVRLDALFWGCAIAFSLDGATEQEKLRQQLRPGVWLSMAVLLGLCIRFYSPLTSVLVAALIPMLLAGTVVNPQWILSRILELPPLVWLGRLSYSLYLWQQLFMVAGWDHPRGLWRPWPENLLDSLVVAALSYFLVEQPMIRLGRRLTGRWRARTSPEVVPTPTFASE